MPARGGVDGGANGMTTIGMAWPVPDRWMGALVDVRVGTLDGVLDAEFSADLVAWDDGGAIRWTLEAGQLSVVPGHEDRS